MNFEIALPYLVFLVVLATLSLPLRTNDLGVPKYSNTQEFLLFVVCLFFIGFRGYIYTDWVTYKKIWEAAPSLDYNAVTGYFGRFAMEPGYLLFVAICKNTLPNYDSFQALAFAIDFFVLRHFCKQFIPSYYLLGILAFFSFGGMEIEINLMRNSKSIMFFLISLHFARDKKPLQYLLLNICGSFFHITSLLYVFLYPFLRRSLSQNFVFVIFVVGNLIYLAQVRWFTPILGLVAGLFDNRLSNMIQGYSQSEVFSKSYGITIGYLERTLTFLLVLYMRSRNPLFKERMEPFFNLFFVYNLVFLYLSEFSILLLRLPLLFVCAYWILIPNMIVNLSQRGKALAFGGLLFYALIKFSLVHSTPITEYDNLLFAHMDESLRSRIMDQI